MKTLIVIVLVTLTSCQHNRPLRTPTIRSISDRDLTALEKALAEMKEVTKDVTFTGTK